MAYGVGAAVLGLAILFISLSRATLQIRASENDQSVLKANPIQVTLPTLEEEETESVTYNLPETGLLPSNPFYGFKRLRDSVWLTFSSSPLSKSKTALLIADRKMAESRKVFSENQQNASFDASMEAIDKLKYSSDQALRITGNEAEAKKIFKQIYTAGLAYGQVIKAYGQGFDIDYSKYQKVVNAINDFNAEQEKAKENWLY